MESRLLSPKLSKPLQIVIWLFAFYIAWQLLPPGYEKLMNPSGPLEFFGGLGYPAAIFYAVAVIETIFPFIVFVPRVSFYGSFPIFVVMVFASYHSNWDMTPLTVAFLALLVSVLSRPGILRKKAEITTVSV